MKKLLLIALTAISTAFSIKIVQILSDIKTDVKKIRIIKVGI